jgi:uncharacterized protein (TIGR00251 family)
VNASLLTVRVTPRAAHDAIAVTPAGAISVRVTAPPTGGRANDAVCRLLAKRLGVAPSRVTIARGAGSRTKTIRLDGLETGEALRRLAEA